MVDAYQSPFLCVCVVGFDYNFFVLTDLPNSSDAIA